MKRPKVLLAFSDDERAKADDYLSAQVATMLGRKFEEGDWEEVYCTAKGIPISGWSNLNIDIVHEGLGVEQKMLCYRSKPSIKEACGQTLMHPAATRAIRIPEGEADPTLAARDVLRQYAELIQERTDHVRSLSGGKEPDMRTGWLLWQESLCEFLYFEEEMIAPDPNDYTAEWMKSGGGARRESRNLWVYECGSGKKRFSITTSAGAKIQPYFDVPPPSDPGVYIFTAQGERLSGGGVQVWVTRTTALLLENLLGCPLETAALSAAILNAKPMSKEAEQLTLAEGKKATALEITEEAYTYLRAAFPGVSDEHMFQIFAMSLAL